MAGERLMSDATLWGTQYVPVVMTQAEWEQAAAAEPHFRHVHVDGPRFCVKNAYGTKCHL
jgi:hypothetical protein